MKISLRRLARIRALSAIGGIAALGLVACGVAPRLRPSPRRARRHCPPRSRPTTPPMREAIDAWRAGGDPPTGPPPDEVAVPARYFEEVARLLASHPNLATATIALLPPALASEVRELTRAARSLRKLSHGTPPRKLKTTPPKPLADLVGYYGAARDRYGIGPHYLAAIHLVETKFGKVKSNSVAGARGPMQFIPSTWRIYGMGGNIKDDHDAILAAANLLRDSGAPRELRPRPLLVQPFAALRRRRPALREADRPRPLRALLPLLLGALARRSGAQAADPADDPAGGPERPRDDRPRQPRGGRDDLGGGAGDRLVLRARRLEARPGARRSAPPPRARGRFRIASRRVGRAPRPSPASTSGRGARPPSSGPPPIPSGSACGRAERPGPAAGSRPRARTCRWRGCAHFPAPRRCSCRRRR